MINFPYRFNADELTTLYIAETKVKTKHRNLKSYLKWTIETNLKITEINLETLKEIEKFIVKLRKDGNLKKSSVKDKCGQTVHILKNMFDYKFPIYYENKFIAKADIKLGPNEKKCLNKRCKNIFSKDFRTDKNKESAYCENCYNSHKKSYQKTHISLTDEQRKVISDKKAEYDRKWYKNNPEKVKEREDAKKLNKKTKLKLYIKNSKNGRIPWKLTDEEAFKMMESKCFYCGGLDSDTTLNGIDRLYLNSEYTPKETVACCSMCNKMKNTIDSNVFIHICAHINAFTNNENNDRINYKLFLKSGSTPFTCSKWGSKNNNREFLLTEEEYTEFTKKPCYICGYDKSRVGVDRFDNSVGYIIDNCRPCCTTCNCMKLDYKYDEVINKCKTITENFDINDIEIDYLKDNFETRAKSKFKKLTKEERVKQAKEYKENKKLETNEKYKRDLGISTIKSNN